jgi:hypothetical protein
VQRTFDLMAEEVPWPDQQFDRVTLAYLVLPMAALYTALRDRGRTEQDAVAAVTRALGVLLVRVERLMIGSLSRTRPGRRLLFEATSALSDALLAVTGPAWEATRVERSRNRMAVDVTRCYIVDTLRLLDAAMRFTRTGRPDVLLTWYASAWPRRWTRSAGSNKASDVATQPGSQVDRGPRGAGRTVGTGGRAATMAGPRGLPGRRPGAVLLPGRRARAGPRTA